MSGYVVDASAFLAIVRDEPGADISIARLTGGVMSAVNASEAFMRGAEKGVALGPMRDLLAAHKVQIIPLDETLAVEAAVLRPSTKHLGLSFADRVCLATAIHLGFTAVTADKIWADLDLPCKIELIR